MLARITPGQTKRLAISTALLVCFFFWGCQNRKPILIGFVGDLSGRGADIGLSGRDAAQMAVEECNRTGGLSGRQVRLIVKNDEQNPETARRAMRELIEEGVVAIIGPMTSNMAMVMVPIANEARIPLISPTVATEALSDKDDYFFRITATTKVFASENADFQIRSGKMRRVAVAYDLDNFQFSKDWLNNFQKAFTAQGGEVITTIGYSSADNITYLDIASKLLAVQPDGVLLIANSMDSAMLCQQIRKIDSRIEITVSDWGATERFLQLGGRALEGVTVVHTFNITNASLNYRVFRKNYTESYHQEPGFTSVHAYDATLVALAALRSRKKNQDLKETILSLGSISGLQNEIEFTPFGDAKYVYFSISVVRNHQFLFLE